MKKFLGTFFVLIIVLLVSLVAVPWNDFSQWAVAIPIITDNEMFLKAGIFGLAFVFSIIFLFVANSEYNNYGHVSVNTARAAFLPLYLYAISILIYGASINYFIYIQDWIASGTPSTTYLLIIGLFAFFIINLIGYGHIFGSNFRKETNGKRIMNYILLVEMAIASAGLTYWYYTYRLVNYNYSSFNSFYFAGAAALGILLYILHIIFSAKKSSDESMEEQLEQEIDEMQSPVSKPQRLDNQEKPKRKKDQKHEVVTAQRDKKKTMIVSNQQTIVSGESNFDPTNMIYENVAVDPEFNKTTPSSPNSIEYYIEKPKMFKPVDPSFDQLVAYVREMPQVVTKLDEDRITFYVDRKPFLVLMNYGNYYRMAFKYDLEKGIRLIIKYPTISKNKSTREELWFKANNYGDIPKEVIYQIVKYSYDSVNL